MSYTTEIITTESEFYALEAEWSLLLKSSVVSEIFQTFTFLSSWWQTFKPGELQVVTIRSQSKELVAIAPLYLAQDNGKITAHLLGCINVSDYLDVLIDTEKSHEVYPLLLEEIAKLNWDTMTWCSLKENSPSRDWLKKYFANQVVVEEQQDICPYIDLPSDWESYLLNIDRKQRHEIRRKSRRLLEYDHAFESISNPTSADIADFILLHKASSKDKREFWDENHLRFFQEVLPKLGKEGSVRLFFLSISKVRAATMLVFVQNEQYQLYNSGFLLEDFGELSVGSLLTTHTIERAIEEKMSCYDFLRGNEAYKFRYTKTSKPIFDITVSRDRQATK